MTTAFVRCRSRPSSPDCNCLLRGCRSTPLPPEVVRSSGASLTASRWVLNPPERDLVRPVTAREVRSPSPMSIFCWVVFSWIAFRRSLAPTPISPPIRLLCASSSTAFQRPWDVQQSSWRRGRCNSRLSGWPMPCGGCRCTAASICAVVFWWPTAAPPVSTLVVWRNSWDCLQCCATRWQGCSRPMAWGRHSSVCACNATWPHL